ncbi:Cold acclimation protein [Musa troglodytarum]|uniref:Cold acclimation protein n=1 Tax=Musa troglodytarum TaxID=320322 RepID=A0A9E7GXE3_9LILI|nr:Cold acclimation protein [Musa troglodytarum]
MADTTRAYLRMKTDYVVSGGDDELIRSDLKELGLAARRLANHAIMLGSGLGVGTTFLKFLASFAAILEMNRDGMDHWISVDTGSNELEDKHADFTFNSIYLLELAIGPIFHTKVHKFVLSRTIAVKGKPLGELQGDSIVNKHNRTRGEVGKWIALIAIVLRLFFPRHFPDWLEMPAAFILLVVVAPGFFAHTVRNGHAGVFVCLAIGCYLLQEHIRASGGFRNSFTKSHGISNSIGIILLLVYPIWRLVVHFL